MRSPVIILSTLVVLLLSTVEGSPVCVDTNDLSGPRHTILMSSKNINNKNKRNMMDMLRQDRRFSRLVKMINNAGSNLKNDLEQQGREKTFMAPTNYALDAMEQTLNVRIENMDRNEMGELLMYHIIPKRAVMVEQMYNGDLLETALDNQKGLGGRRQVIRVNRIGNRVALNMYSRIVESDIQTENGVIQALSEVMYLPRPLFEMMTIFPTKFSTHAMALQLTGLDKKIDRTNKLTALIATNEAWESMGFVELMELFAPENRAELKQVMLKHYIPELAYVQDLAAQKGMSAVQCAREQMNESDNSKMIVRNTMETMSGEQVTLRIVCRAGELRAMVDESSVSIQDIPAENGVAHLMTSPMVMNKNNNKRHRRNPHNGMSQRKNNQNYNRRSPRFTFIFEEEIVSMNNRRRNQNNPRHPRMPRNQDDDEGQEYDEDQDDMNMPSHHRRQRRSPNSPRMPRNPRNQDDDDQEMDDEFDFSDFNRERRAARNHYWRN